MRITISLCIGWVVAFGLLALGAGWFAPLAGATATFLALEAST